MSEVKIQAQDGGSFDAYIAMPEQANAPAIIMIQEIFGVNAEMRAKCDAWAEQGYIAIAPDLFWRQEPGVQLTDRTEEEWDKAFKLFNGFDVDLGVKDLDATLSFIRQHEACNGKVANIGYCLGGRLSYLMATRTDIDASVSYYGVGIEGLLDEAKNISTPILMHIAEEDEYVSKEAQSQITGALSSNDLIQIHSYEGMNHAFSRINGAHYDETSARLANGRTSDFIKSVFGINQSDAA